MKKHTAQTINRDNTSEIVMLKAIIKAQKKLWNLRREFDSCYKELLIQLARASMPVHNLQQVYDRNSDDLSSRRAVIFFLIGSGER